MCKSVCREKMFRAVKGKYFLSSVNLLTLSILLQTVDLEYMFVPHRIAAVTAKVMQNLHSPVQHSLCMCARLTLILLMWRIG
jgi:hypothetical protein